MGVKANGDSIACPHALSHVYFSSSLACMCACMSVCACVCLCECMSVCVCVCSSCKGLDEVCLS